jgi:SAM-dependent methyltransferase
MAYIGYDINCKELLRSVGLVRKLGELTDYMRKLSSLVVFPIWKNDGKAVVALNDLQKKQISNFLIKIKNNEYNFIDNPCLCRNTDKTLDILISEKDRYGIACDIVLCKKCGLIRLRERLNDYSTAEFYKNEYRDIYVGQELASDDFFITQAQRGQAFYNLIRKHIDISEIKTVFEIGCGAGGILYPFYQEGKKVSGCDFGEKYLKFGQDKGLDLYQGEVDVNKTPKKSQDLVILSHVMEHFNEPIRTMNGIIELIDDEKYLLVEVPGVFDIKKTYFNPILYFQNAHVYNYYYYLKVFFETLGLEVIYGNERCTFLLKKPIGWVAQNDIVVYDETMSIWVEKVENELKKYYLLHLLKLNPYYLKIGLIKILDVLGIKQSLKKALGR